MRAPSLCTLVLASLCVLFTSQQAQAQYCDYGIIYGASWTWQDSNTVYSYSGTALDYCAGLYYDPAVYGRFSEGNFATENVRLLAEGYTEGFADWIPAEIYFGYSAPRPYEYYNTDSIHYVLEYYQYYTCFASCGYYWYDPWGFGFLDGNGSGPNFYGYGNVGYWGVRRRTIGRTRDTIIFQPYTQPTPTPTPVPTPSPTPQCGRVTIGSFYPNDGSDLNGQTRSAIAGVRVSLIAQAYAANGTQETGTNFVWEVTGNPQREVDSQSSNRIDLVWGTEGSYTARVTYTPNGGGCSVSATVNVNVVIPQLTSFTAQQSTERVTPGSAGAMCGGIESGDTFTLGCNNIFRDAGHYFQCNSYNSFKCFA